MSACGGCRGINCYNGTIEKDKNVFNDNFENYDNLFEKIFNHKRNDTLHVKKYFKLLVHYS